MAYNDRRVRVILIQGAANLESEGRLKTMGNREGSERSDAKEVETKNGLEAQKNAPCKRYLLLMSAGEENK